MGLYLKKSGGSPHLSAPLVKSNKQNSKKFFFGTPYWKLEIELQDMSLDSNTQLPWRSEPPGAPTKCVFTISSSKECLLQSSQRDSRVSWIPFSAAKLHQQLWSGLKFFYQRRKATSKSCLTKVKQDIPRRTINTVGRRSTGDKVPTEGSPASHSRQLWDDWPPR